MAEISLLEAFKDVLSSEAREKVLYGGSGSGKTHVAQQYVILKAIEEPGAQSLVVMETQPGVLTGMYYPMREMLYDLDIPFTGRESTPMFLRLWNDHTIWFISADNPEKIKYITNPKRVVINEATSLTEEKFNQLMNRMGRTHEDAELIFTFNPIDHHHWLVERYVNPHIEGRTEGGVYVHHSTYHDNPFLAQRWSNWLESMEQRDTNFYRIYALGLPGTLEGLIFEEGLHWIQIERRGWPDEIVREPPKCLGVDWGFNDPTAVVALWEHDKRRYAHIVLYQCGHTQADTALFLEAEFKRHNWRQHVPLYCDPSRPEQIEDLRRRGFTALKPVNKDVRLGLSIIKEKELVISSESMDLIKELRNYRWKEKSGKIIDEPVDEFNHAIDAMRYAMYSLSTGQMEYVYLGGI